MVILSRFLSHKIWKNLHRLQSLNHEKRAFSAIAEIAEHQKEPADNSKNKTKQDSSNASNERFRFIYPEFLPDPNPLYRNNIREKLERIDMLARRSVIHIPEFYVGSIMAVTYSEPHATGKVNRFVGICILREGTGLRSSFILRNVVNNEPIEVRYELYDPAIQKIDCLRLEKRLDNELLYLRDAPEEYSTFPFDMQPEIKLEGTPVKINEIKIPLKDQKWFKRWEREDLKGVVDLKPLINEKRRKQAVARATPWEKYDLMKIYRNTIPEEDQNEILSELQTELSQLEVKKSILKHKHRSFRPKKSV